ncbi:MAG: hypothetical protein V4594_24140 [Bacteroidota bacterium]
MSEDLRDTLLTVCTLLEKHKVQYMLIGGTAVALHGYYRMSMNSAGTLADKPDIDLWFEPSYENYSLILKVIEELGQDITDFKNEQNPNPRKSFFKLDFDNFSLDILPEIKASIRFLEAYKRKETVEFGDTLIHFMNYSDLIEDKKATARKKDLEDVIQLKKHKGEA